MANKDPKAEISLGRAFKYCFTKPSYIVWFIIAIAFMIAMFIWAFSRYKNNADWTMYENGMLFVGICAFFGGLLGRPTSIKANTTNEMADREPPVYIG